MYTVDAADILRLSGAAFNNAYTLEEMLGHEKGVKLTEDGKVEIEFYNNILKPSDYELYLITAKRVNGKIVATGAANTGGREGAGYYFRCILEKNGQSPLEEYRVADVTVTQLVTYPCLP